MVKMFILTFPKIVTWISIPSVKLVWNDSSKLENNSMLHIMWLLQPESKYHMSRGLY
jgi:hypothetical protein